MNTLKNELLKIHTDLSRRIQLEPAIRSIVTSDLKNLHQYSLGGLLQSRQPLSNCLNQYSCWQTHLRHGVSCRSRGFITKLNRKMYASLNPRTDFKDAHTSVSSESIRAVHIWRVKLAVRILQMIIGNNLQLTYYVATRQNHPKHKEPIRNHQTKSARKPSSLMLKKHWCQIGGDKASQENLQQSEHQVHDDDSTGNSV
jgi:hypothetical protein